MPLNAGKLGVVQYGLYPALVETADGTIHAQVRIYATDDYIELWKFVGGQPTILATGAGLVKQGRGVGQFMSDGTRAKWTLALSDGTVWLASPGGGCGCSDPNKRWNPAKHVRV